MDFSRCKELVTLAEKLNFSKAADALFITQSTLSKHVASAENEIGFRIFTRNTTKVELTKSGSAFIKEINEAIAHYETGISEGIAAQHDIEGTIKSHRTSSESDGNSPRQRCSRAFLVNAERAQHQSQHNRHWCTRLLRKNA